MKYVTKENYAHYRDHLKSGDLLAWRGHSSVSRFIRTWTGSDYSHVGLVWRAEDRVFIIEASEFSGVRIRPLSKALPCYWLKTHVNWVASNEQWLLDRVGEQYSYLDAIRAGMGLKPLQKNGWQCAEFAAHALKLFRVIERKQDIATPQALVQAVVALNS